MAVYYTLALGQKLVGTDMLPLLPTQRTKAFPRGGFGIAVSPAAEGLRSHQGETDLRF
jgi:hypothetical protein